MRASLAAPLLGMVTLVAAHAQDGAPWPEPRETPPDPALEPVPEDPVPQRRPEPPRPREKPWGAPWVWDDEPSFESHVRLSAFWQPGVKIVADVDPFEPDQGIEFHAKLRQGSGWGGAFAIGAEHVGLGGLYLFSEHRERRTGDICRAHAGYLELTFEGALPLGGPILVTLGCGIGLGGAVLDFQENTFHDAGGLSVELRAWAGVRLLERVELTAGGGVFDWGVPGETIGYGAFGTLGITLRF